MVKEEVSSFFQLRGNYIIREPMDKRRLERGQLLQTLKTVECAMRGLRDDEKSQTVHRLAIFHLMYIRYMRSSFDFTYRRPVQRPSRDRSLSMLNGRM